MDAQGGPRAKEPLLERGTELHEIAALLERTREGTGGAVVVEGHAGLGKTRLLDEVAAQGREQGLSVLRCRGGELERDFAFGLALQLFEPPVRAARPAQRKRLLSGTAALAGALFEGDAIAVPEADDAQPFALVHGLYWLSANLAEVSPLLVLMDDVHWGDSASLRFLLYLLQRVSDLQVALVATLRPSELGSHHELVGQLRASPNARVITLSPLSLTAVGALVVDHLGPSEEEFVAACAEVTQGNPFLLHELLGELQLEDVKPTSEEAARVGGFAPEAVSRAVLVRLLRLPDPASDLARAVAVLGDDARLRHAAELAGVDQEKAVHAADALAAGDILKPGEPLSFTYPMVGAAVYAELPPAQRSAAHQHAARLLRAEQAPAERIAAHLMAAGPSGDPTVVDVLQAAAQRALQRGAPDSAAVFLRRALDEPPDPERRPELLAGLGRAEAAGGEPQAFDTLREAASLEADPVRRARVLFVLGRRLSMTGHFAEAAETFDSALAPLDGADPELSLQLEAGYVTSARLDVNTRPRALERLASLRRGVDGSSAIGRLVLSVIAFELAASGGPSAEVRELATRALGQGNVMGQEDTVEGRGLYAAAAALAYTDDLEGAERALGAAIAGARLRGSVTEYARASAFRAHALYRLGRLSEALADATAALENATYGAEAVAPATAAVQALALLETGQPEEAERALELPDVEKRFAGSTPLAYLLDSRARVRLATGRPEEALEDFLHCGRLMLELGAPNPAVLAWRSGASRASAATGDRDGADRLWREELDLARAFGAPRAVGIALIAGGLLERGEAATALLGEAVAELRDSPSVLERARALVELGAAMRRDGGRRDSIEPLREGLLLARDRGATALAARAEEELTAASGRGWTAKERSRDRLTPGEHRVAEMAATGLTNRQIAQDLFVTIKAVEWHLGNSYRKLGITSRKDLAAALAASAE